MPKSKKTIGEKLADAVDHLVHPHVHDGELQSAETSTEKELVEEQGALSIESQDDTENLAKFDKFKGSK